MQGRGASGAATPLSYVTRCVRVRHKRPVRYHPVASEVADQGGVGNDDLVGAELSGDEGYCDVG